VKIPDLSVSQAVAYGINLLLIYDCFERRITMAFWLGLVLTANGWLTPSTYETTLVSLETVTAKPEYCSQLRSY